MNTFFEQKDVEKIDGEKTISYVLNDSFLFSKLEYKMLMHQEQEGLIKCMKVEKNGNIKLVYLTEGYHRLNVLFSVLSQDSLMKIMIEIINIVVDLSENSLGKCCHLDIAQDRVFVDLETEQVYLIYLPVSGSNVELTDKEYYEILRSTLVQWIEAFSVMETEGLKDFKNHLSDFRKYSLKDIYSIYSVFRGTSKKPEKKPDAEQKMKAKTSLVLAAEEVQFRIEKDEFIIGRQKPTVDGYIPNCLYVGRKHCKITKNAGQYYITDLKSTNFTYLNAEQLKPYEPHILSNGDTVRIANIVFSVILLGD